MFCGYLKIAENNINEAYNLNIDSDSDGSSNQDITNNESIVPDYDSDSSDIEVSLVRSSEVSNDHTDFGDEWDDNGPNAVNDATITDNVKIPNWTPNFTDLTSEPFTKDSGPSLPENFDVSVAAALDFFNLLFKLEIFSDRKDHTNNFANFKQEEIWRHRNNPVYVDSMLQETTVEELKTLFGINILMALTKCHSINCTGIKMTSLAIVE